MRGEARFAGRSEVEEGRDTGSEDIGIQYASPESETGKCETQIHCKELVRNRRRDSQYPMIGSKRARTLRESGAL